MTDTDLLEAIDEIGPLGRAFVLLTVTLCRAGRDPLAERAAEIGNMRPDGRDVAFAEDVVRQIADRVTGDELTAWQAAYSQAIMADAGNMIEALDDLARRRVSS